MTGVATSAGVESTARSAYDYGYNVVLVTDAMTDRSEETHRHCVEKIFPRLGETDTTDNVAEAVAGDARPVSRAKSTARAYALARLCYQPTPR